MAEASATGWCATDTALTNLQHEAMALGLSVIPNRPSGPVRDRLRPTRREAAQPRSLSAVVGLGAQPLHTDGAHHKEPPGFVILAAPEPSATPTIVWQPPSTPAWTDLFQRGVFVVDGGANRFLAPAMKENRLRFDPGCMRACDGYARALVAALASVRAEAYRHEWTEPGALVIDNWRALHARAAVLDPDTRVIERIALQGG